MVTVWVAETCEVLIVNVAVVLPEFTVTVWGTVAEAELDFSATVNPNGPAGAVRVTVPVVELPPITDDGEMVTL